LCAQPVSRRSGLSFYPLAETLGIKPIEKAQPYVTQLPHGPPGSRVWAEQWIVSNGGISAAIDIHFVEDGVGGATWAIDVPMAASEQKQYVAAAQEFVRQSQAGNVDRMIGWTLDGRVEGTTSFSFFITVMKENDKYVVITLGRRAPDNSSQEPRCGARNRF